MQSQFVPRNQSLRFNKHGGNPDVAAHTKRADVASAAALLNRRNALLQDYNKLHHKSAWSPAASAAFRVLLVIRIASAMYSPIKDCDETYNYWEPLHLLIYPPTSSVNAPFQTWEYSPQFAIRSWAYLVQYVPIASLLARLGVGKRQVFFSVRILLALISTFVEARFYKAVADTFNTRIGRYLLVILAVSAGMFEASTALLPSSFAMYATMLAYSFWLQPARLPSNDPSVLATPNQRPFQPLRLVGAVASFATGAIVGWPFAILLSAPFLIEQLLLRGDDVVPANRVASWLSVRWSTFAGASLLAALVVALPLWTVDTLAYGKATFVPLNIIRYNLFSAARGAGPELYGTEPASFYFANLLLNFNVVFPLALLAAPLLVVTALYDPKRLQRALPLPSSATAGGAPSTSADKGHADAPKPSDLFTLVALRIAPFYLWLGLLTLQPHKEERFMYPSYPLLCMNAAISLYLIRSLLEVFYVRYTKSPYRASRSRLFGGTTALVLSLAIAIGLLRTVAQLTHYHAPFDVLFHLEEYELPRVIVKLFPQTLNDGIRARIAKGLEAVPSAEEREYNGRGYGEENAGKSQDLSISLKPLQELERPIRLCYGKEWHRFPTHFLVPAGVEVQFISSDFDGILPRHFDVPTSRSSTFSSDSTQDGISSTLDAIFGDSFWSNSHITRSNSNEFNDINMATTDQSVSSSTCDYLVDLDNAHRYISSTILPSVLEPRYAVDAERWDRVFCKPFLDSEWSRPVEKRWTNKLQAALHRSLWIPSWAGRGANVYGDYCLLRNRESSVVAH